MEKVTILTGKKENNRLELGIERLSRVLKESGYEVQRKRMIKKARYRNVPDRKIYIGIRGEDPFISWLEEQEVLIYHTSPPKGEGFYLESCPGELLVIVGGSDTGALYGCLELRDRIQRDHELPMEITFGDEPVFKLRGPAVGLQKTKVEPPRLTYEYPITPDRFPWFYDRALWTRFLEMLLDMRCNVLYLWSGHPFSSLVKVPEYPEALEVTEEEFQQNQDLFRWLTSECDRRGIWVVLKFYNIHIPLPFAEAHGLDLLQSSINPLVADYTKASIREFVQTFPHIGLMVCLGEALRGNQNKTDWFVNTIIPGVKEGIEKAGLKEEPPLILRGHDCDPVQAVTEAKKLYKNLYTMWKYNGESLTTFYPRGKWQQIHQSLSALGTTHILNIHILANLEPFQFNAPLFIQKCVQAGQNRLGGNGLHLYPLFYWDWPYSPDKENPRLLQMDRDYIWYKAWFRYAWKPDRDEDAEREYWISVYENHYHVSRSSARALLDAGEHLAYCSTKILGRVGITEGNRQTMSLGMTMGELINPEKYHPNRELWESVDRKGERLQEFADRELAGKPHVGEVPLESLMEGSRHADRAAELIRRVYDKDPENRKVERLYTDAQAIYCLAEFYLLKVMAALRILYCRNEMDQNFQGDYSDLDEAGKMLRYSLIAYKALAELTDKTYLYANSMQTPQRKIPFPDGGKYGHWRDCLPEYQAELANFQRHMQELKEGILPEAVKEERKPLKPVPFKVLAGGEDFELIPGESLFSDCARKVERVDPPLCGLTGIRMSLVSEKGISLSLELFEDSLVLVGYFQDKDPRWLQVPELETNTHADLRGGLSVVYPSAVQAQGCPAADIHAFRYEKGTHEIYLGTGAFFIAGVVDGKTEFISHREDLKTLEWMFMD